MVGLAFLFNLTRTAVQLLSRIVDARLWSLSRRPSFVYAQEARMYAAFFALTAATLYFAWRVFEIGNSKSKIQDRKLIAAFLLCEAGLLLTHYFAIPLVVALNLLCADRLAATPRSIFIAMPIGSADNSSPRCR